MQENLTLARPYAQAAFEQATAEGATVEWSAALALLNAIVSDAQMRSIISDPRISQQRLVDLLLDLGGSQFGRTFQNFIKVLTHAHRLPAVGEIAQLFEQHRALAENVAYAEIVTPYPLEAAEEARIAGSIQRRLGKEVRIKQRIDPALIGGAVVRIGDTVYDLSLRGGLNQLSNLFNWK